MLLESVLIKASVRCWSWKALSVWGGCLLGGCIALATSSAAQAQMIPSQSLTRLPLNTTSITDGHDDAQLEAIALNINTQIASERAQLEVPEGMSLDQVPVVGDLLDEEGNFDWGVELPVSFGVADVMGSYGVVLSTDFSH